MACTTTIFEGTLAAVTVDNRDNGTALVALRFRDAEKGIADSFAMYLRLPEMRILEDALREYREQAEAQAVVDEMSLQFADLLEPSGVSA